METIIFSGYFAVSIKNVFFLQGPKDNRNVPDPVDLVSKLYKQ